MMAKKYTLSVVFLVLSAAASAQFVAKMEIKEPIDGLCHANDVYAIFPMFEGQSEAVCPVSINELLSRLNKDVQFVKDNPRHNDKGMIGLVVNCKGDVVKVKMDRKTKDPELDRQIEAVFASLGGWKPGKINGNEVDTSKLFSFRIKKGTFSFD